MSFSNEEWAELCLHLPKYTLSPKGGRPRLDNKQILEGILFVFKNKTPWKAVPKEYGSGTALNEYFREWARTGVFHKLKENHQIKFLYLDWEKIDALNETHHNHQ
jgi:transposase